MASSFVLHPIHTTIIITKTNIFFFILSPCFFAFVRLYFLNSLKKRNVIYFSRTKVLELCYKTLNLNGNFISYLYHIAIVVIAVIKMDFHVFFLSFRFAFILVPCLRWKILWHSKLTMFFFMFPVYLFVRVLHIKRWKTFWC